MKTSGSHIVDQMHQINITGNVIPMVWFDQITFSNGKPNTNAIMILADIVYWYRPNEVRDEQTGRIIALKKKFSADLLQRSYNDYTEQFGFSKKQVYNAILQLEEMGLIQRIFRNICINNRTLPNVMYLELNTDRLKEITFPCNLQENDEQSDEVRISSPEGKDGYTSTEGYPVIESQTNTENTSEISTEKYLSINRSAYEELIQDQIGYDYLMLEEDISLRKIYEEMFLMICDIVCQNRKSVRIGKEDLPYEVVKSRFLKLEMRHLQYAAHTIRYTTSEIRNIRSYILTTLYHAPETITAYWTQKASHDMAAT